MLFPFSAAGLPSLGGTLTQEPETPDLAKSQATGTFAAGDFVVNKLPGMSALVLAAVGLLVAVIVLRRNR